MSHSHVAQIVRRRLAGIRETIEANWIAQTTTKFTLALSGLGIVILIWRWNQLPPMVPLWYSKPWGDEQLAQPIWLLLLPGGSIIWYIFTLWFVGKYLKLYRIFGQILFLAALTVSLLSTITLINIIFLVT